MADIKLSFAPRTLYNLAQIVICKSLWNNPSVKELLLEKLSQIRPNAARTSQHDVFEYSERRNKSFYEVYGNIEKLRLPVKIKKDLLPLARIIGFMIWDWLIGMRENQLCDMRYYLDNIQWSREFTIDVEETYRTMYHLGLLPLTERTWTVLSYCCLEDCLEDFYGRVNFINMDKPRPGVITRNPINRPTIANSQTVKRAFSYYWYKLLQNRLNRCIHDFHILLDARLLSVFFFSIHDITLNMKMFMLSYGNNNFSAVQHFWKLLTEKERREVLVAITKRRLLSFRFMLGPRSYLVDSAMRIRISLAPYAQTDFIILILEESLTIRAIYHWPFEDLFMRILDESWPTLTTSVRSSLEQHTFTTLHRLRHITDHEQYQFAFDQIWLKIHNEIKRCLTRSPQLILLYYNVDCMNTIINDPALDDVRDDLIDKMAIRFLTTNASLLEVTTFCANVLRDDDERTVFRGKLYLDHHPARQ